MMTQEVQCQDHTRCMFLRVNHCLKGCGRVHPIWGGFFGHDLGTHDSKLLEPCSIIVSQQKRHIILGMFIIYPCMTGKAGESWLTIHEAAPMLQEIWQIKKRTPTDCFTATNFPWYHISLRRNDRTNRDSPPVTGRQVIRTWIADEPSMKRSGDAPRAPLSAEAAWPRSAKPNRSKLDKLHRFLDASLTKFGLTTWR